MGGNDCVVCIVSSFLWFRSTESSTLDPFQFLFEILSRGESEVELQSKERTLPLNLALLTRLGRTGYRKRKTFSFLLKKLIVRTSLRCFLKFSQVCISVSVALCRKCTRNIWELILDSRKKP